MTLLEECNKPIKPKNIISVLKAQYDKRKPFRSSQDNEAFMSKQSKGSPKDSKVHICANCNKKGHTKEQCWSKGGGQEGQGPKQHQNKKPKKKKGKEKAHAVEKNNSSDSEDNDIAFTNSEAVFVLKTSSGVTHILDTGANAYMTPHKYLLRDYKVFDTSKCISAANKGIFNALGVGMMVLPAHTNGKSTNITLKICCMCLILHLP
jgi:hypothetical protein